MTRQPGGSFVSTGQTREQPSETVEIDRKVVTAFHADLLPAMSDYVVDQVTPAVDRYLQTITKIGQHAGIHRAELDEWSARIQTELAMTGVELSMSQPKLGDSNWGLVPESFPKTSLVKEIERLNPLLLTESGINFHTADPAIKALANTFLRANQEIKDALSDDALFGEVVLPTARKHGLTGPQ